MGNLFKQEPYIYGGKFEIYTFIFIDDSTSDLNFNWIFEFICARSAISCILIFYSILLQFFSVNWIEVFLIKKNGGIVIVA